MVSIRDVVSLMSVLQKCDLHARLHFAFEHAALSRVAPCVLGRLYHCDSP